MNDKYILVDGEPIVESDVLTWGQWMQTSDRSVARTEIDDVVVLTVFLGLDHSFGGDVPILFETTIFGGVHDEYQERYATREAAIEGHEQAVAMVRGDTDA